MSECYKWILTSFEKLYVTCPMYNLLLKIIAHFQNDIKILLFKTSKFEKLIRGKFSIIQISKKNNINVDKCQII